MFMRDDIFFARRCKGIEGKCMDLVLCEVGNNVDVRVAVIFGHGDQIRYFNTHPHEENWPFPTNDPTNDPTSDLKARATVITSMEKCDQSEKQREMMTKWKNRHGLLKTVTVAPIKQEDGMLAPFDPLIENWDPTMFSEPQPIAVQPAQPAETKVQPFHEAIEEDDNDSSEDENASSSEEEEYCDDADNGAEPLPKRRQLHRGWNNGMAQLGHPPIAQMYGQTGSGYKPLYSNVPSGGQQGYPTGPFANGHPPSYISNFQSPPVRTRSMAAQGSSDLPERPRLPPRKTSKRSAATVGVKKRSRSRKTS